MNAVVVRRVTIFSLTIPLRRRVEHAATHRAIADPVVVAVELQNGVIGYGETLPRPYVTGETVASVVAAVQSTFLSDLMSFHPQNFGEALTAIDALRWNDDGGDLVAAARAAVELALLDASMRAFDRDMEAVVRFLDLRGFELPGSLSQVRFSGVLATTSPVKMKQTLRLMYWGGLRDFKLKVGFDGDLELVRVAANYLAKPLARNRASLRVDANGAWSLEQASEWVRTTRNLPIRAIEQPLAKGSNVDIVRLKKTIHELNDAGRPRLMHDESLITMDDATNLEEANVADGFNIRLSKCGGMLPSLRLAAQARQHRTDIQLGCMVGETSILSGAGLRFLSVCPNVRWAEGCFGSFLLSADVVDRPLRFGYGGRPPALCGDGFGSNVEHHRLVKLCETDPIVLTL